MMHALRRTTGSFAAGTRVEIKGENSDGTITVEVLAPNPSHTNRNYDYEDMTMDIDPNEIVKLRNRTDSVPATSRQERRAFLKGLFGGTKEVK